MLFQLNKRVLPVTHFGWDTNVTRDDYWKWIALTRRAARHDREEFSCCTTNGFVSG